MSASAVRSVLAEHLTSSSSSSSSHKRRRPSPGNDGDNDENAAPISANITGDETDDSEEKARAQKRQKGPAADSEQPRPPSSSAGRDSTRVSFVTPPPSSPALASTRSTDDLQRELNKERVRVSEVIKKIEGEGCNQKEIIQDIVRQAFREHLYPDPADVAVAAESSCRSKGIPFSATRQAISKEISAIRNRHKSAIDMLLREAPDWLPRPLITKSAVSTSTGVQTRVEFHVRDTVDPGSGNRNHFANPAFARLCASAFKGDTEVATRSKIAFVETCILAFVDATRSNAQLSEVYKSRFLLTGRLTDKFENLRNNIAANSNFVSTSNIIFDVDD